MLGFLIGTFMKNPKITGFKAVSAFLLVLSLTACGTDSPEAMLASAKDYLAKNDAKAAVIQLKNALQSKPDLAEARFLLGKALLDEGNVSGADVELRKAAELKYPAEQLPLGFPTRPEDLVVDEFGKMQLSSPESRAELQTTLGNAYLVQGKPDAAKQAFDAALSAVADYGPAVFGQARLKVAGRDVAGAMALLDSALEKNPKFLEARQLKGDLLAFQGKSQEAQDLYRQILDARPDYVPAHISLISRQMEAGKLDEAEKQFEAMRKIMPRGRAATGGSHRVRTQILCYRRAISACRALQNA